MQSAAQENKPKAPAALPRVSLPVNKLSGSYILSMILRKPKKLIRKKESEQGNMTKVYIFEGREYVVPPAGHQPPAGTAWFQIGRYQGRVAYKAALFTVQS